VSAFGVQDCEPPEGQAVFGTKDPILAATLGNMGFQARHSLPVLLVVSAASVINLVDRKTGRVADCAHLEFRFEAQILDDVFGLLRAQDVSFAHEIAKLAQKEQTKEISGAEALKLQELRQKWKAKRIGPDGVDHKGTLLWVVQKCYDQITNFLVVCVATKELAKNPLIEFSKAVHKGVAYAIEPCNTEPQAQRRSEKLFRK
jgi:hypothetical protein